MWTRLLERIQAWQGRGPRWLVVPSVIAAIMAVLAIVLDYNFPALANAEQFLSDLWIARLAPPEDQDPDIVVVAVRDETLDMFPYSAPLDRKFISDLLKKIASEHPRVIGLDYLFDKPTEMAKDDELRKTLAEIDAPLFVSYALPGPVIVTTEQEEYLNAFVPKKVRALANLPTDQFDVVRNIYPGAQSPDGYIPGFARAIAEAAGAKTVDQARPAAWHGKPAGENMDAFAEYPAHVVPILPPTLLTGKIVLIGSDITLVDRHHTPFNTSDVSGAGMAGVVVQAHAVSQWSRGTRAPEATWEANLAVSFIIGLVGALFGMVSWPVWLRMTAGIGFIALYWVGSVTEYHFGGPMFALIAPTLSMGTSFFAMEAVSGTEARAQREFIKGVFSHHVAPKVVDQLLSDPARVASLEGERREMTFLFTDVADFTTMSEGVDSKELGRVLNAYLEVMTDIVQKHGGMVDKFIGDAVFAIFNAPIDQKDHAEAAVRCGLEMDRFALGFSDDQHAKGIPFGRTRVGINTGTAVVGNFGSRTRHNYTASGDAVNTASRLEGLNKHFGTRISVSGATHALCPKIRWRPTASVVVKGKKTAIDLYEPLQDDDPRGDFIARYSAAYEKLKESSPEAPALFEALGKEAPDDPSVAFHLGRIHHGVINVAVVMTEK